MKKSLSQGTRIGAAVALLSLATACYYRETVSTSHPYRIHQFSQPVAAQAATAAPVAEAPAAPNAPESVVIPAPAAPIEMPVSAPELSPAVAELAKLAQAQVGEEVLLNYIAGSRTAFNPTADELVFLADIGVSENVINALIQKSDKPSESEGSNDQVIAGAAPTGAPESPAVVVETPNAAVQPQVAQPTPVVVEQPQQIVVVEQAQPQTVVYEVEQPVAYFQPVLAPYGTWVDIAPYGLCWQPSVAVVNTGWRPYGDRGRWLYTDNGWYWQSDYSWGWAPFHYGRWHRHSHYGWVWTPGGTWGPAWVSWRRSSDYCGWAPLPPAARYRSGFGFVWHDSLVAVHFDWGLSYSDYCYVPLRHFHSHHPRQHFVARNHARSVHSRTRVINEHHHDRSRTVVNRGVPRDEVARLSREEIRRVRVVDQPAGGRSVIRPDRVVRNGDDLAIYRGGLRRSAASAPGSKVTSRAQAEPRRAPSAGSAAPSPSGARTTIGPSRTTPAIAKSFGEPARKSAIPDQRPQSMGRTSASTPSRKGAAQPRAAASFAPSVLSRTSPPKPVTSTPSTPRASVGGLTAPKPVTSRPSASSPAPRSVAAPRPVTSTPTAPRIAVGGLTPPKPVTSTPKPPALGAKALTPPSPVTSTPVKPAAPKPVSIVRAPGSSPRSPLGAAPLTSGRPQPTGSTGLRVNSTVTRRPTPSPSYQTPSRTVVRRTPSPSSQPAPTVSQPSSSVSRPITGFQNPRSAIQNRPTPNFNHYSAPRTTTPSQRLTVPSVSGHSGSFSSQAPSRPSPLNPTFSRPAPAPTRIAPQSTFRSVPTPSRTPVGRPATPFSSPQKLTVPSRPSVSPSRPAAAPSRPSSNPTPGSSPRPSRK